MTKLYDITVQKNGQSKDLDGMTKQQVQALQAKGCSVVINDTYTTSEDDYNSIENKHCLQW